MNSLISGPSKRKAVAVHRTGGAVSNDGRRTTTGAVALLLAIGLAAIGTSPTLASGPATEYPVVAASGGGGPDSEGGGPVASVNGFAGVWDTVTGENHKFVMTLNQSEDGTVSGTYTGVSGSGTLQGTIGPDGKLVYQWTQDGFTGAGIFELAPDGLTFSGTFSKSSDPTVINGSWFGTRQ